MPQETNLNVSPYFDDFDQNKNYYKVLFKPGYPVQARELTTLQSILQNQIEKFGDHIFKEGAKVIPGQTSYNNLYNAVELNNEFLGLNVSNYIKCLVGIKIKGERSGISAIINKVLNSNESERGNVTIYVSYLNADTQTNGSFVFEDNENLIVEENVLSCVNSFLSGQSFASTIALNSNSLGSSFTVSEGVYYLRGHFVNVPTQTIILDQYSNNPDYRIGFTVLEEIITSSFDESLTDNSKGFNNYAAPGADRLKITAILDKKSLDDVDTQNFVEISRVENGILRDTQNDTFYNIINDKFARRTFEESGDYYVDRFSVSCEDSLNNNLGNNGIFSEGNRTYQGNVASDDLAIYKISAGKAYVRGYEIQINAPTFLDIEKPRTTKNSGNESVIYSTGRTLALNRVSGSPIIGVGNTYTISLRNRRISDTKTSVAGEEIGLARVFDFALEEGSYRTGSLLDSNRWDISLFDIQTYTKITLNQPVSLNSSSYVIGNSSGATGYVKDEVSESKLLTLYNVNGKFLNNESFTIDGIRDSRVALAVTSYNVSDVKSVYSNNSGKVFNADTIQDEFYYVGICSVTKSSSGISTIIIPGSEYFDNLKVNDIVSFTNPLNPVTSNYAKVEKVDFNNVSTLVNISGVTTVFGVCEGTLPSQDLSIADLRVLTTNYLPGSNNSLYAPLSKQNVLSVDLTSTELIIRKQYTVNITNNSTETIQASTNEFFLPYDEERYSLIRSDGTVEVLSEDKIQIFSEGRELQIKGLSVTNDTGSILISTLRKTNVKSKVKKKARVRSLIVDKSTVTTSGIGTTTRNDGLEYGPYPYGTRVQDSEISLNVPDVIRVHGIYESIGLSNPSAPKCVLSSIVSPSSTVFDLIIGEKIVGKNSNAVAIVAEHISSNEIALIYKNDSVFTVGEVIEFKESKITAIISSLETPSKDISKLFSFDTGQRDTYYDYGKIVRNEGVLEPQRKLKIYFDHAYYDSQDDGDITTSNSYQLFDYKDDILYHNEFRLTDIIDIRPRVSDYTLTPNAKSPFEFEGRRFNQQGNSSSYILASDESLNLSYNFYLPRIDRIFLDKNGNFVVKKGIPDENPKPAQAVNESLEIASIFLPAYLYETEKASITSFDHKRYQMSDISKLETRIKNLEYYTTLSLLETETSNLQIVDSSGINRFKSGFFVDNFTSLLTQEDRIGIRNSVDPFFNILRPSHYTNSIDILLATKNSLGIGVTSNEDLSNVSSEDIIGSNIRKSGDLITLDYQSVEFIKQPYATKVENVQPYILTFWSGDIQLNPPSDIWVDTVRLDPLTIQVEGDYIQTVNRLAETSNLNPQTGLGPAIWGSWSLIGYGTPRWVRARAGSSIKRDFNRAWRKGTTTTGTKTLISSSRQAKADGLIPRTGFYVEVVDALYSRSRTRLKVTESFDTQSLGDVEISTELQPYIRSRNIEFRANKLKPSTKLYAFFDGVDVTDQCFSKLLEVSMRSGTFIIGETVDIKQSNGSLEGSFRLANPRHKKGKFDAPTETFSVNPYNNQSIPSSYLSTSTLLNIDTSSMSIMSDSNYYGLIKTGYTLVGKTSKAIAVVTDIRLIADNFGEIIGSFFITNPNIIENKKFKTGIKEFRLTSDQNNNFVPGLSGTSAKNNYFAEGQTRRVQEKVLSVRNASVTTEVVRTQTRTEQQFTGLYIDPLAQSFACDEENGVFLTKIDVYFQSKDASIPVSCQIRTMELGTPTQTIVPFSEVTLNPDNVNISDDASIPTTFEFESPVYIESGKEYAIVLLSNSTSYFVWISSILAKNNETGEFVEPIDTITGQRVTTQPILGSLFKSQNASTWSPSQFEDLKFTLYRAEFNIGQGSVNFYNPPLTKANNQLPFLTSNPLDFISRKVRVGLSNTITESDSSFPIGSRVIQNSSGAFGTYAGKVGLATGGTSPNGTGINIDNAGIGYTPASGSYLYNNVPLITVSGEGTGARANITIQNGVAIGATIISGGYGYKVGDVLTANSLGNDNLGRNLRISVGIVSSFNEIILEDVQGEFNTGVGIGNTLFYYDSSGSLVEINSNSGGNITPISPIKIETDGLHFRVRHSNHGMHSPLNYVKLSGVSPDTESCKTNQEISSDFIGALSVTNSDVFTTFEDLPVSPTNPGYAIINGEIIKYTSIDNDFLDVVSRGIDETIVTSHLIDSEIKKYEINGVSLLRINKTHRLESATVNDPIGIDYYTLKLDQQGFSIVSSDLEITDRSSSSILKPELYFRSSKFDGGFDVSATQNMQFELITPLIETFTPNQTDVSADVRTVTGKSISGNEISFVDQGYSPVSLGEYNYFSSPRLICSSINETNLINEIPGNKSFNMLLTLTSTNSKLSPCIDLTRTSIITTTNRVNKIVGDDDYPTDNRVNSLVRDQNAFLYITKSIRLQNPATSLKLYVSADINIYSDIRALYSIDNKENSDPVFELFPGFNNLNTLQETINPENSDGRPDIFTPKNSILDFEPDDFAEYEFTANGLPSFTYYRIKLILTSTSQAYVPQLKDIRVIALA